MNGFSFIQKPETSQRMNGYLFVCLSTILVGLVAMLIDLHDQAHDEYKPNEPVHWREPFNADVNQALKSQLTKPIGNSVWDFQYTSLIQILWRAKVNDQDELVIDSEALELLKRASAALPQALSSEEFQRLGFVIKKSIPSSAGKELANVLNQYYLYDQENMTALQRINSVDDDLKRVLLASAEQNTEERQVRFFGKSMARKLFSEHNRTQNYLNTRRLIKLSELFTATQKKEHLDELRNDYQKSLQD